MQNFKERLNKMKKCVVMFSAGLDSVVACHLMKQQGIEVVALHFVLPFKSGLDLEFADVKESAKRLGVELLIKEEGTPFLEMIESPQFGYGKNVNPCIDCRIHRVKKAIAIMKEIGADFLVTGEVIGQRPMSQHRSAMENIAKKSDVEGLLLRPLSAKLLEPTIPEIKGWVDRDKLLNIDGRGRKRQLAYAKKFNLLHQTPGGGCLLTESETTARYNDMKLHQKSVSLTDFKLIAFGRHFRISDTVRLIIGRNATENDLLEKLKIDSDTTLELANDVPGPLAICKGKLTNSDKEKIASILVRYTKLRDKDFAEVQLTQNNTKSIILVKPATPKYCEELLVR